MRAWRKTGCPCCPSPARIPCSRGGQKSPDGPPGVCLCLCASVCFIGKGISRLGGCCSPVFTKRSSPGNSSLRLCSKEQIQHLFQSFSYAADNHAYIYMYIYVNIYSKPMCMCVCANSKPMYTQKTPNHKYSWIDPKVHLILRKQSTHTQAYYLQFQIMQLQSSVYVPTCVLLRHGFLCPTVFSKALPLFKHETKLWIQSLFGNSTYLCRHRFIFLVSILKKHTQYNLRS